MATAEEQIEEIWELFRETDRKMAQTDRQMKETDRKMKETDRKIEKTNEKLEEALGAMGDLGNRLGEFVEHAVEPAVVGLFRDQDIKVHEVHRDIYGERHGRSTQVDLLVVNDDVCVVVEVKSKLDVEDVDGHLERLDNFKTIFPLYSARKIMGAVAARVIPEDVASYAYRQGLYVLGPTGEDVGVLNDESFEPRIW